VHLHADIDGAQPLHPSGPVVGGDIEQLLARESDPAFARSGFLLLYGKAQWLAGQLERCASPRARARRLTRHPCAQSEIDEGMWQVLSATTPFPWPLGPLPLLLEIRSTRGRMRDGATASVVKIL